MKYTYIPIRWDRLRMLRSYFVQVVAFSGIESVLQSPCTRIPNQIEDVILIIVLVETILFSHYLAHNIGRYLCSESNPVLVSQTHMSIPRTQYVIYILLFINSLLWMYCCCMVAVAVVVLMQSYSFIQDMVKKINYNQITRLHSVRSVDYFCCCCCSASASRFLFPELIH